MLLIRSSIFNFFFRSLFSSVIFFISCCASFFDQLLDLKNYVYLSIILKKKMMGQLLFPLCLNFQFRGGWVLSLLLFKSLIMVIKQYYNIYLQFHIDINFTLEEVYLTINKELCFYPYVIIILALKSFSNAKLDNN